MNLSELLLNRFLYKEPLQNIETKDSTYLSSNQVSTDNALVSTGDTVFDINTNSQYINGSMLNPNSPIPSGVLNIANYGWAQTSNLTVASLNTVTWSAGTFTSADGTTVYSIGSGTTGVMAAKTYIYLDMAISTTAYQVSTNMLDAIGIGKVLIAVAQNGPTSATVMPVQTTQISGDNILANSIAGNKIVAGSITATQISSAYIYAGYIAADHITAGIMTGMTIRTNATSTRIEMNGVSNSFLVYYAGDIRAKFSGDSLLFNGPGGVSGGAISSFGTNQVNIDVGGGTVYEFNENGFEPMDNETQTCGTSGRAWVNVVSQYLTARSGISLNGEIITSWSDIAPSGVNDTINVAHGGLPGASWDLEFTDGICTNITFNPS